jgi:two-component system, NtrC family, response regulator
MMKPPTVLLVATILFAFAALSFSQSQPLTPGPIKIGQEKQNEAGQKQIDGKDKELVGSASHSFVLATHAPPPEPKIGKQASHSDDKPAKEDRLRKIATTDVPVLLFGEKGTGKRLAARTIHQLGSRLEGPFTVVNCDSIPRDLFEVEFFGYEKGAYASAHQQKKGYIERSHGGTIFLNDIHALSLSLQAALIHYIEEKTVVRVGASEAVRVDARLIAASDQDLECALKDGNFRDDLYFSFVTIPIPPLRARRADMLQLARSFLTTSALKTKRRVVGFRASAENAIIAYTWPGNIRELENRVRRAVVMAEGSQISTEDLGLSEVPLMSRRSCHTLKKAREELDRKMIGEALAMWEGSITKAADSLGISRPTLYELMVKLGIPRA